MRASLCLTVLALLCVFQTQASAQGWWGAPPWTNYGPGWNGWAFWAGGFGSGNFYNHSPANPYMGTAEIKADVNYSSVIDLGDKMMGKDAKFNPGGLLIGAGELTKLLLNIQPNGERNPTIGEPSTKMPFHILVGSLELRGVNLGHRKGKFKNFEEEVATCGRLLVWLDHTRKHLLLDSADPARRRVAWPYANSLPPERVFVEGVTPTQPGGAFIVTLELDDSNRRGLSRLYSEPAVWDRQFISVIPKGVTPKPYEDTTPVWSKR